MIIISNGGKLMSLEIFNGVIVEILVIIIIFLLGLLLRPMKIIKIFLKKKSDERYSKKTGTVRFDKNDEEKLYDILKHYKTTGTLTMGDIRKYLDIAVKYETDKKEIIDPELKVLEKKILEVCLEINELNKRLNKK